MRHPHVNVRNTVLSHIYDSFINSFDKINIIWIIDERTNTYAKYIREESSRSPWEFKNELFYRYPMRHFYYRLIKYADYTVEGKIKLYLKS